VNWRELCKATDDVDYKSDILRAVLKTRNVTVQEISDIVDMMETLPIHLQSYIAWDVICKPQTTAKIYKRVKHNPGLLAVTTSKNIRSTWERNHIVIRRKREEDVVKNG
jgi:hypothetical protein